MVGIISRVLGKEIDGECEDTDCLLQVDPEARLVLPDTWVQARWKLTKSVCFYGCISFFALWFTSSQMLVLCFSVYWFMPLSTRHRVQADWNINAHASKWCCGLASLHEYFECSTTVTLEPQWSQMWSQRPMWLNRSTSVAKNLSSNKAVCNLMAMDSAISCVGDALCWRPYHPLLHLYSCWSWWQLNPHSQRIACFGSNAGGRNYTQFILDQYPRDMARLLEFYGNAQVTFVPCNSLSGEDLASGVSPAETVTLPRQGHRGVQASVSAALHAKLFGMDRFFYDPSHADALRIAMVGRVAAHSCFDPVVAILNRQQTRRITNSEEIIRQLQRWGNIREMTFEKATFSEQLEFMSTVSILISPLGSQLWATNFMPRCSGVLEIFPRAYSGYHFAALARDAGILHMSIALTANHGGGAPSVEDDFDSGVLRDAATRKYASELNLCPQPSQIALGVRRIAAARCSCMEQ